MLKFKDFRIAFATILVGLMSVAIILVSQTQIPFKNIISAGLALGILSLVVYIINRFWSYWFVAIKLTRKLLEDQLTEDEILQKRGGYALLFSNIKSLLLKFKEASSLIHAIGDTNQELKMKHLDNNDSLGKAILDVQAKMKRYRDEEEKRSWGVQGLANFSETLRHQDASMKEFSAKLIAQLVRYLSANQGAFFVAMEDAEGPYLELTGAYAYDKRKYLNKRINPGEGLVGQCMLEKDVIFLTDIPKDYISITSGLGHALPTNVVIIPLINNDIFQGAIEIATFNVLESHQISFLKELATSIASSIATTKVNEHTQVLLKESQTLTQELQRREEEMRQSMEELNATQEEMRRKQIELDGVFSAINNSLMTAELSLDGRFMSANEALVMLLGKSYNEMKGISHQIFFHKKEELENCWSELLRGEAVNIDHEVKGVLNTVFWLSASYTPVLNAEGRLYKVLMLAHDITSKMEQEKEFEKLSLVADNTDNSVIITDMEGRIEYVNKGFTKITQYTLSEVKGRKPGQILQGVDTNKETVARISQQLKSRQPIYEEILNYNKSGESYWVSLAINPVLDSEGNLYKFIAVQADITGTKKAALDAKYKLEAISRSNAVIEFNTDGSILDVNDNFLKIMGYQREELIGKHHRVFVTEKESKSAEYQVFCKKLARGEFIQNEFIRVHKSGSKVCLRGVYNPIFDINGKPYKIVKFATDITAEKQLKLETQKQEAELKSHMEAINKTIASVEFNLDGIVTDCNDIYLSITSHIKSEVVSHHYNELIPAEEKAKPQTQLMWQSLKEGQFFSGEYKQTDKDGHELWLNGTFNPIFDESGKPYKVMLFAQFTTKEKEKQNELTGMVNALKSVMPVLELTEEGVFKNANELYFQELGFKRLDLRQKAFNDLIVPKTSQCNFQRMREKCEVEGFCEESLTFKTQSGENKVFRTRFVPVNNLEHQIHKFIVILIEKENKEVRKEKVTLN